MVEKMKFNSLFYNNQALTSTQIENFLINETNNCIKEKDNILVCYPNQSYFIRLVIEAVLKNEMDNFQFSPNPSKRTSILIISKNKELVNLLEKIRIDISYVFEICRKQHKFLMENNFFCNIDSQYHTKLYWRHFLSKYYENSVPENIPLHYILPISVGYHRLIQIPRGNMNKIGRKDKEQESVFMVTGNVDLINSKDFKYDYLFIDFTTINKKIPNLPRGTLGFFHKPLDERISYFNHNKVVKNYTIGSEILEQFSSNENFTDSPFYNSISEMISSIKISNINIEYIQADFECELENAFELLMKLVHKRFDTYDLNLLRILLYNTIKMPVEGVIYDSIAKFDPTFDTIYDLIRELKESDNRYEDNDFEQIIKSIENVYNKYHLDTLCPKYQFLKKLITSNIARQRTVGIISSNKIRNLALKEKLAATFGMEIERLEELGIKFFNKMKIINKQQVINSDDIVMLSATSVSDFNIFNNFHNKKVHILLYKIEINELTRKFNKLKDINNLSLYLFNPNNRDSINSNNVYTYFYNRLRKYSTNHDRSNLNDDPSIPSITKLNELIKTNRNIPAKRSIKDYTGENAVSAKLLKLEGNGAIFLRKNSKVRFINKIQKKLISKNVFDIENGDEIVLIDNDSRKELFNIFINNTEIVDHSLNSYNIIEKWREKYEDKYVSLKLNDDILYKKLKELGWDKTSKSILSNWRSGYSFGPRDLKDIELLGKALNIDAFSERANEYFEAMSRIRVERRVAARLLNTIIYYSKRPINNEDLAFLSRYNLSLDDVKNAVKVRKVIGTSEKVYNVKPSEVGILFE